MAHPVHFSCKPRGLAFALLTLALTGCTAQSPLSVEGLRLSTHAAADDVRIVRKAEESVALKPTLQSTDTDIQAAKPAHIVPVGSNADRKPAWCDYLTEDTAAQTTIMRSPNLSASSTDDGKASVSLGLSVSDFAKARVLEQTAEARCRRYMAESGLHKLVFLSPQGLTSAGYRAKAKAIVDRKADIQALRRRVAEAMNAGDLDREKATLLMGLADQLLSEAGNAKSQADRRTGDFLGSRDHASVLGRELKRAEADLEDLQSRMRTFDAMNVSVSAGWSDDVTRDDFAVDAEGFSGKVSVSMKLGALLPQRFEHERRAKEAKLQALGDEGGALWQVNVLRLAHERAIQGLVESESKIDQALAETDKLLAAVKGIENPEVQVTGIGAKFRKIQLQADRAAVRGSLAEIRTNMQRLKTNG